MAKQKVVQGVLTGEISIRGTFPYMRGLTLGQMEFMLREKLGDALEHLGAELGVDASLHRSPEPSLEALTAYHIPENEEPTFSRNEVKEGMKG